MSLLFVCVVVLFHCHYNKAFSFFFLSLLLLHFNLPAFPPPPPQSSLNNPDHRWRCFSIGVNPVSHKTSWMLCRTETQDLISFKERNAKPTTLRLKTGERKWLPEPQFKQTTSQSHVHSADCSAAQLSWGDPVWLTGEHIRTVSAAVVLLLSSRWQWEHMIATVVLDWTHYSEFSPFS